MSNLKFYGEISKADDEKRLVWGYASTEALDAHDEIITKEAIQNALDDYMKFANIREMHQASAVGVAESAEIKDKGLYLCAKIVDDDAWKKVKEGVYKGFSVGGKMISKVGNKITAMKLNEISLVDRPACPEAIIEVFKIADEITKKEESLVNKELIEIKKSMNTVARLSSLIQDLAWITSETEWEKQCEGDASQIPQNLRDAVKNLGSILVAHVVEEVSEQSENLQSQVVETDADKVMLSTDAVIESISNVDSEIDLEKSGKRNNKSDQEKINQIFALLKEIGAEESIDLEAEKSEKALDIQKSDFKKFEDLENDLKKHKDQLEKSAQRIKELESMPAQSKAIVKSVSIDKDESNRSKVEVKSTTLDIIKSIQSGSR